VFVRVFDEADLFVATTKRLYAFSDDDTPAT
jgi:hypothetical protein